MSCLFTFMCVVCIHNAFAYLYIYSHIKIYKNLKDKYLHKLNSTFIELYTKQHLFVNQSKFLQTGTERLSIDAIFHLVNKYKLKTNKLLIKIKITIFLDKIKKYSHISVL